MNIDINSLPLSLDGRGLRRELSRTVGVRVNLFPRLPKNLFGGQALGEKRFWFDFEQIL
jgi:hypothetical protein